MPDREEVVRSIYGAYLLARLDRGGMNHFNLTVDGFWRSFFAAILVAPGYAILVAQKLLGQEEAYNLAWVALVQGGAYVVGWAAFPLAALVLTTLLKLSSNYAALIIAANWAAVIQIGLFLAALALTLVLPGGIAGLLLMAATVGILFYQWFVTRTALQTTGGVALALVLVDLLLNTAVNLSADRLL